MKKAKIKAMLLIMFFLTINSKALFANIRADLKSNNSLLFCYTQDRRPYRAPQDTAKSKVKHRDSLEKLHSMEEYTPYSSNKVKPPVHIVKRNKRDILGKVKVKRN